MGDYEKLDTDFLPFHAVEDDSLWELLSVYADGEATPQEAAQIETLLRSDPALKREFNFMRMASAFVSAEPEIAPPAALRDRIFAATLARPDAAPPVLDRMGRFCRVADAALRAGGRIGGRGAADRRAVAS